MSKEQFDFDSLTSVHEELQSESSDPTPEAIASHHAKETAKESEKIAAEKSNSGVTDSTGAQFNPEIHATSADGEPSLTATGKFRKKRGTAKSRIGTTNKEVEALRAQQQRESEARAAATMAVTMSLHTLQMLLGDEWKAEPTEREVLDNATGNYFVSKEINDFPPGVALAAVCFAFVSKRVIEGEETQNRLGRMKFWVKEKWQNIKRKSKNARSNSGDDGKRKDNAGKNPVQHDTENGARDVSSRPNK